MLKRLAVLCFSVGLSLTGTGSAVAQEHNLPTMNAFGRFFGIGWSNGYHSGAYDGRFQHVKNNHPAKMYGSNALLYPYQSGYEPHRPFIQASQGYVQPVYSNMGDSQAFGSILQHMPNQTQQSASSPTPVPAVPPKPVEPPPTWLRPFLKDDAQGGAELPKPKTREGIDADEAADASPSDLLKPKANPANPKKEAPAKSSDDDDLLTLSPPKSAIERYNEARSKAGSNR